jgi:hypothetical protein
MASTELSRRVKKLVGYPPLSEMSDDQRRDFHDALLDANSYEDLNLDREDDEPIRIASFECRR